MLMNDKKKVFCLKSVSFVKNKSNDGIYPKRIGLNSKISYINYFYFESVKNQKMIYHLLSKQLNLWHVRLRFRKIHKN